MALSTMEQLNVETSAALPDQNGQIEICEDDFYATWSEEEISFGDDKDAINREWERRHSQFHTMGYRDGIIAGKEDSAQEGYNGGYKESFSAGYGQGLVRGISSAISTVPNHLKEKLISKLQNKDGFQKLYESLQKNGCGEDGGFNQVDGLFESLNVLLSDSAGIKVDLNQIKDSAING